MNTKDHLTMHDLPVDDRPTEKLEQLGASVLSDAELMAVIIRSGSRHETALSLTQRLIRFHADTCGQASPLGFLSDATVAELTKLPGIGRVKALQLQAAVELGRRVCRNSRSAQSERIRQPLDVLRFLEAEMADLSREELRVVLLDSRNRLIRIGTLSTGGLSAAVIQPRDLFRDAVKANAAAVILVHNHPSGDPEPSQDDLTTTAQLCQVGTLMGIRILDHLIIGRSGSVSLRQLGQMP